MIRILLFIITSFICIHAYATEYNAESNIINLKHGYQLGDLLVVEDQITIKEPFLGTPKLLTNADLEETHCTQTAIYEIFKALHKII